jgi:hypothetical protein
VLRCCLHCTPDGGDKLGWHRFVKQVRHRVHKYPARLLPACRYAERVVIKPYPAGPDRALAALAGQPAIFLHAHRIEPRRHPHRVAVRAAGRDDRAACDRVPCRVGPFDRGVSHHSPLRKAILVHASSVRRSTVSLRVDLSSETPANRDAGSSRQRSAVCPLRGSFPLNGSS